MSDIAKKAVGEAAAEMIKENMRVGLGTGSTAAYFIQHLGKRCKEGLHIQVVSSSKQSEVLAKEHGIPLANISDLKELDIVVDGADEIDPQKNMIKGGGGALLREKILASMAKEMVVIVDENKVVKHLGAFPLPVEIIPFAYPATIHHLENLGYKGEIRSSENDFFVTDNGNYIWDVHFSTPIESPINMDLELKKIPGVVETGLFHGLAGRVIVGYDDGHIEMK